MNDEPIEWQLAEQRRRGGRYFTIERNHVRIADIFQDAGMYHGIADPEWVIEQAQLIVDTMNARAREAAS